MSLEECTEVNNVPGSANLCTGKVEYASYGYNVNTWVAVLFVALFGGSTILHVYQAIRSRKWYALYTITLCGAVEAGGWGARLWSAISAEYYSANGGYWFSNDTAFMIQISTLIIAPALLTAFWYLLLGRIIVAFGPQYCRFKPKIYAIVFMTGDILSLVIQGGGGGMASSADDQDGADLGANIMVTGVFFQMFVMTIFSIVLADFVYHYLRRQPVKPFHFRKSSKNQPQITIPSEAIDPRAEKKARLMILGICISSVFIFIRSVYRDIELLGGWHGPIIENEMLFCVLDGAMVVVALAVFNVLHPLYLWPARIQLGNLSDNYSMESLVDKRSSVNSVDKWADPFDPESENQQPPQDLSRSYSQNSQNYPPQNYPPQNYPSQNFPPQNVRGGFNTMMSNNRRCCLAC